MNHSKEQLVWVLKHMFFMGTWKDYLRDPGVPAAVYNFHTQGEKPGTTYFKDAKDTIKANETRQLLTYGYRHVARQIGPQMKGSKGLYKRLSRDEKIAIRNIILRELTVEGGWAEEHRRKLDAEKMKDLYEEVIDVTSSVKLGDIIFGRYCTVLIEVGEGFHNITVEGRKYADAKALNPSLTAGRPVRIIAYGEEAADVLKDIKKAVKPSLLERIVNAVAPREHVTEWQLEPAQQPL